MLGLFGVTAVNRVEMEFSFVHAVALIQRQVQEEDELAKEMYSILWDATLIFTQASV